MKLLVVIDPAKRSFPFNSLPATDARDRDAIEAWAGEVAGALAPRETSAGAR